MPLSEPVKILVFGAQSMPSIAARALLQASRQLLSSAVREVFSEAFISLHGLPD